MAIEPINWIEMLNAPPPDNMDVPTTWDDVMGRSDLIGGNFRLKSDCDSHEFRGPILGIEKDSDDVTTTVVSSRVVIRVAWCASNQWQGKGHNYGINKEGWFDCGLNSMRVDGDLVPCKIGDHQIMVRTRKSGILHLCPKSTPGLDSRKVKGLRDPFIRLLALYPELPYDYDVLERVCIENGYDRVLARVQRLPKGRHEVNPTNARSNNFISMYLYKILYSFPKADGLAEVFLMKYIEAVTGTDMRDVVY